MIDREKQKLNPTMQKVKCAVVIALYLLFLLWVGSWWGIIVVPFIFDAYITKKIRWQWWKDSEGVTRFVMSWVDALVFALVAVYFINLFFFQNYVIPSSSLEKSLLTGDYLFVSKVSYGPRIPQTPLTLPLTQHTLPIVEMKSYIEWPQWDYRRVEGLGSPQRGDIVVFNYPAGDTICTDVKHQTEYYQLCYGYGIYNYAGKVNIDSLDGQQRWDFYRKVYQEGKKVIESRPDEYGQIDTRPTDRRENYVKRCIALPGDVLEINNCEVFINGKKQQAPERVQFCHRVKLNQNIPEDVMKQYDISMEDIMQLNQMGFMPLTTAAKNYLLKSGIAKSISRVTDKDDDQVGSNWDIYPQNGNLHWTRDNYGPVWIPKKGMQVPGGLTLDKIAIYARCITAYEGNTLDVKGGKIYINGKPATNYTFKLDYYWMMGDNRHNSADSRYWGFVPEDHIVGKPIFIWWSSDPDRGGFPGIRWNRLFNFVDNIK